MILEVGVFAEAAAADVALERPRSAVHVHVRLEVARSRERLGAKCALVRFLLRIQTFVFKINFIRFHFILNSFKFWGKKFLKMIFCFNLNKNVSICK